MINKTYSGYVVDCDFCSNYLHREVGYNFSEAVQMVKDEGWKIRIDEDGNWTHICPVCVENKEVGDEKSS